MDELRDRLMRHVRQDYRAYLADDGLDEEPLLVRYFRGEYENGFRIRMKRVLAEWGVARNEEERQRKASVLLSCALERLLLDDGLTGKAGKCLPACERTELVPLVMAGWPDDREVWRPHPARCSRAQLERTRDALIVARERLKGDAASFGDRSATQADGPSSTPLDDRSLRELAAMLLSADIRNKNFTPCERVMERGCDLRLAAMGAQLEGIAVDADELAADRQRILKALNKVPRETRERVGLHEGTALDAWLAWWDGSPTADDELAASRLVSCLLHAKAVDFLRNAGVSLLDDDSRGWSAGIARTKDVPVRLVDMYLREVGDQADAGRATDEDTLDLLGCMAGGEGEDALVPVRIDPRTGGGLYVMGRRQIERYCQQSDADPDLFPRKGASLVIVDHLLGSPSGYGFVDAQGRRAKGVGHRVRVVEPTGVGYQSEFVRDDWERALSELGRHFQRLSEVPLRGSIYEGFWFSYQFNCEELQSRPTRRAPAGCPPAYSSYFRAQDDARTVPVSLSEEGLGEDLSVDGYAVVPSSLVEYLAVENGQNVGRCFSWRTVMRDESPVLRDDAREHMELIQDEYGLADVLPVVVQGKRSQDRWNKVLQVAVQTDQSYCLFFLGKYAKRQLPGIDARRALAWIRAGRVDEQGKELLSRIESRAFQAVSSRSRA